MPIIQKVFYVFRKRTKTSDVRNSFISFAPRPQICAFGNCVNRSVSFADISFKVDCFLVSKIFKEVEKQQTQSYYDQQYGLCFGISHHWKPAETKQNFTQLKKKINMTEMKCCSMKYWCQIFISDTVILVTATNVCFRKTLVSFL